MRSTKWILVIVSGIISAALLIIQETGTVNICGGPQFTECMQNIHIAYLVCYPFFAVFVLSLFASFLNRGVVRIWVSFTCAFIPVSMLLIFIAPTYGGFLNPVEKGSVAVVMSGLFVIISLVLIGYKYWRLSRSKV